MISLDTETTGVDRYHGAQPFFVTTCDLTGGQLWWEWDVDPLTRRVLEPADDLAQLDRAIAAAGRVVLQNSKFDVGMLKTLGVPLTGWPWQYTEDTLIAAHLLYSNQPHDLTSLALHYLGINIAPLEEALEKVVQECRRYCRSHLPEWAIARAGRPDMPSAKEKTWKFDTWLPRALVKHLWETSPAGLTYAEMKSRHKLGGIFKLLLELDTLEKMEGWELRPPNLRDGADPRWTVLRDYANADSAVTIQLWQVMEEKMTERSLTRIYRERMKALPIAFDMEQRGVTVSGERLAQLTEEYTADSAKARRVCTNIAAGRGYTLEMPNGSRNKALMDFLFTAPQGLRLPVLIKTDTGQPALNKAALEAYFTELEPNSQAMAFVRTLAGLRKRTTAITYMEGYQRFWLPVKDFPGWYVLHPSLNPTGTDTLRWSSSNPNEQNIAKKEGFNLRYCFGPAPGREWWSLDAQNIELRLPAYESGQQELIDLFERPDEPPYYGSTHLLNFHTVYPDLWSEVEAEVGPAKVGPTCKKRYASTWYQYCKNGGFAVQYGAVEKADGWGTADKAFHKRGAHALLKARFGKLEALNQHWIRFAEKHGYVETIPDRTVDPQRGYPVMCTRTEWGKVLPTVPLNYHIQSSAMWWTMKAMIRVEAQLAAWRKEGFDGHMVMQVHDEIVLDFPRSRYDPRLEKAGEAPPMSSNLWRANRIRKIMAQGGDDFNIPTPVNVEYHPDNWSEGITL